MNPSFSVSACLLGMCLLAAQGASWAQDAPAAPAEPNVAASADLKAAIDPATGRLRAPSPSESRALEATAKSSSTYKSGALARLQAARPNALRAGDARVRVLGTEYLPMARAARLEDGHLAADCVDPAHAHEPVQGLQAEERHHD